MSLRTSIVSPAMSSGDAYALVPAGDLNTANESASESPKSIIFTFWPLCVMSMFSGLRSLCIICLRCMYPRASQISQMIFCASALSILPSVINPSSEHPSIHSMMMQLPI